MKNLIVAAGMMALFAGTAAAKDGSGKAGSFVTGKGKCEGHGCATSKLGALASIRSTMTAAEARKILGAAGAATRFKAKEGATLAKSKASAAKSIEGVPTSTSGIKLKASAFSTNTHRFDPYKNFNGVWTDMRPLSAKKGTKRTRPTQGTARVANSRPVIVGAPPGVKKRSRAQPAK